jgi:hypothetical protein
MKPENPQLYEKIKKEINVIYPKNSAYRSMAYIKKYKEMKGTFIEDGKSRPLQRWQQEKWVNINTNKKLYPVFRPSKIIDKIKTPLTVNEISTKNKKSQIRQKQSIKGSKNLKPFIRKKYSKRKTTRKQSIQGSKNIRKKYSKRKQGK